MAWGLSDDPALPMKWTFPPQTIAPHGTLMVFASGAAIPWIQPETCTPISAWRKMGARSSHKQQGPPKSFLFLQTNKQNGKGRKGKKRKREENFAAGELERAPFFSRRKLACRFPAESKELPRPDAKPSAFHAEQCLWRGTSISSAVQGRRLAPNHGDPPKCCRVAQLDPIRCIAVTVLQRILVLRYKFTDQDRQG